MNFLKYINNANTSAELVQERGITPYLSNDFRKFKKISHQIRGQSPYPVFDPDTPGFKANDGLWLMGQDIGGEIVQLQAMRFLDLTNMTLAEHLGQNPDYYADPGIDFDYDKTEFEASHITAEITGRVLYHGEFWLSPSFRGGGFTGVFPRMLLTIAIQKWDPDWIFGLQAEAQAYRGLGQKEGYVHTDMRGIRWAKRDGSFIDDAIVWFDVKDMRGLLRFEPVDIWNGLEALRRR